MKRTGQRENISVLIRLVFRSKSLVPISATPRHIGNNISRLIICCNLKPYRPPIGIYSPFEFFQVIFREVGCLWQSDSMILWSTTCRFVLQGTGKKRRRWSDSGGNLLCDTTILFTTATLLAATRAICLCSQVLIESAAALRGAVVIRPKIGASTLDYAFQLSMDVALHHHCQGGSEIKVATVVHEVDGYRQAIGNRKTRWRQGVCYSTHAVRRTPRGVFEAGGLIAGSDECEKCQDEELGLSRSPWKPCCRISSPATPFTRQRQHSIRRPSRIRLPLAFPKHAHGFKSAAGLVQL